MNKIDCFKKEINCIKDERLKDNFKRIIELLPDYFFHIQASSSGKYHPDYALGEKGLVRHSKVAFRIGYELLNTKTFSEDFTDKEIDLILMSILVHDGLKHGLIEEQYTRFDHPLIMANFLTNNKDKFTLSEEEIKFMSESISSHMGQWNTDKKSGVVLPLPTTKYQKFVHLCDYLSSRKFMNVKFVDGEIVERECI